MVLPVKPTDILPKTGTHSQADCNRLQRPHEDTLSPRLAVGSWRRQTDVLAQHGHEVINPKLPDEDFAEAVRIAQAEFDKHKPAVIVGSSRGGAVAMNINSGEAKLVLLCPAWKRHGTANMVKPGTVILHSWADDVVSFADSEELIKNSGLPASALIEVSTDHRLADPEPLRKMLEACEASDATRQEKTMSPANL
jgi:hypothetical protein